MRKFPVALVLLVGLASQVRAGPTELAEANYSDIREAILLRPSEERWREIPWRPSLAAALDEARKKDKPILLWMMNGHPCGMT